MGQIRALLLDLDDTLLDNDMAVFLPAYLPLLAEHACRLVAGHPDRFVEALLAATRATITDTDPDRTCGEVFWERLARLTGVDWVERGAPAHFDAFYRGSFHRLRAVTAIRPAARPLVDWALAAGLDVVIATNPLFPRTAIEARLTWADLPPAELPLTLVTVAENMHATKPNPAYYLEILEKIGRRPAEGLMVGNDWRNDVEPAAAVDLPVYWIDDGHDPPPTPGLIVGRGSLSRFFDALKSGQLNG